MAGRLGVDLGTTFTAAAISRDGRAELFPLGATNPVLPSVVFLREDGELVVGDIAVRRASIEPTRVGREFKRRLRGSDTAATGEYPVRR